MSPLSVAQYLPADGRRFDLVVFDEASQIGTHDAIGAIARGDQVVIVGDSKQLPPTTFFMRTDEDDEGVLPDDNDIVELESVLDEAIAKSIPEQMLGWHYRSRHHSLIEFSNQHYYQERLNVFPAARARADDLGVVWHPVPDGVYHSSSVRESPRTNPIEARALVAHLVSALRTTKPAERTFGVVTFNLPQRELVQDLLDEAIAAHPEIEPHFASSESVFVKNLENVQGDERDEMYFSICYARDAAGKLRMHFGPLSSTGGERRLNVAITRARCQLRVFSTLRAEDIDLTRTASIGTHHLRDFLDFVARHGEGNRRVTPGGDERPTSLVAEMRREISVMGYQATADVGCGGYRIDLAVEHPSQPGRYVLGVECDGPRYAAAHTARDRDRLRAAVLASLGWKLHRVWSAEWWVDREGELVRLKAALEAAIGQADAKPVTEQGVSPLAPSPAAVPATTAMAPSIPPQTISSLVPESESLRSASHACASSAEPEAMGVRPYIFADARLVSGDPEVFHDVSSTNQIRDRVLEIVRAETPVHEDRVARAVADSWSILKLTGRVHRRLDPIIVQVVRDGLVRKEGAILWDPGRPRESYEAFRGPATDGTIRPIDQIAPEELANAAEWILRHNFSIEREELMRQTMRFFGVSRMGANVAGALQEAVNVCLARGRCVVEGERVVFRQSP